MCAHFQLPFFFLTLHPFLHSGKTLPFSTRRIPARLHAAGPTATMKTACIRRALLTLMVYNICHQDMGLANSVLYRKSDCPPGWQAPRNRERGWGLSSKGGDLTDRCGDIDRGYGRHENGHCRYESRHSRHETDAGRSVSITACPAPFLV
jgi:hypothetical protein